MRELRRYIRRNNLALVEADADAEAGAPTVEEIRDAIMNLFDKDGNGKIGRKEYKQTVRGMARAYGYEMNKA